MSLRGQSQNKTMSGEAVRLLPILAGFCVLFLADGMITQEWQFTTTALLASVDEKMSKST